MLWIAIHLPELSLESWAATLPFDLGSPLALVDAHRLTHANAAAQALGVSPGIKRATALALAPGLLLGQADASRDAQALSRVAHAALAFTPMVSLSAHPASTVLLEVQASLRCFGGQAALLRRLQAALRSLRPGHRACVACAPTPQGAALLACWAGRDAGPSHDGEDGAGRPRRAQSPGPWQHRFDAAPVDLLAAAAGQLPTLQGMGLRTLGALRRLPRAGLARRFGEALVDEVDRILGARADPRLPLSLPDAFSAELELWTRADTIEQVLPAAEVLLGQLVAWVRARHGLVRRFELRLLHERRRGQAPQAAVAGNSATAPAPVATASTVLPIALAQPSADPRHLRSLLGEHLGRLRLREAPLGLSLRCTDWVAGAPPPTSLFPMPQGDREGLVQLIERLQARLGAGQVRRLQAVADHRPECASLSRPAEAGGADTPRRGAAGMPPAPSAAPRPVWLLNPPQALDSRPQGPWLDGHPLQLLHGPERIETGWWDGLLAERDYFIARQRDGALVWVYRLRHAPVQGAAAAQALQGDGGARHGAAPGARWFLQGRFG